MNFAISIVWDELDFEISRADIYICLLCRGDEYVK